MKEGRYGVRVESGCCGTGTVHARIPFLGLSSWTVALLLTAAAWGLDVPAPDEFRIKREAVFEFAQKPQVTREGDQVTIAFESKAFCDATVAIANREGRIVRHLVSGVLGPNAPEPFQKNAKAQTLVWDGKNDGGAYVDELAACTVRVSLGLKPRFERTLYWSPHKRVSNNAPLLAAAPEGVYVFQGLGVDHLRLFDHSGAYVRTIYPFPAEKIPEVQGLQKYRALQDGQELPVKHGFEAATLLTSGSSALGGGSGSGDGAHTGGFGATAMAVHPKTGTLETLGRRWVAVAAHRLNRLASDGSSGGLPFEGPRVAIAVQAGGYGVKVHQRIVEPTSVAFSPDGKRLYLTGYVWKNGYYASNAECFHTVMVMDYEKQDEPRVFAGVKETDEGFGAGNARFCVPLSVDCDAQGRVYVADHVNNRIQVFSEDGRHLKSIPAPHPAVIQVDPRTGEIWSFSWPVIGPSNRVCKERNYNHKFQPSVARLGTFDQPVAPAPGPLPGIKGTVEGGWAVTGGQAIQAALAFYAPQLTLWRVGRMATQGAAEKSWGGGGQIAGDWSERGVRLDRLEGDRWQTGFDFGKAVTKQVQRAGPSTFSRQRLYTHPSDGSLYVCEEHGEGSAFKSFHRVLRIDPATGRSREISLPFDTEDLAFDRDGLAYLKTDREVVRFTPQDWREVPWDYGEERDAVRFSPTGSVPAYKSLSALPLPGRRPVWWHNGGMWVSPLGNLAVVCNIPRSDQKAPIRNKSDFAMSEGRAYRPLIYPGRVGSRVIHIYDRHGKLIVEDAVPGLTNIDGLGIDRDNNLYMMVGAPRLVGGKAVFSDQSEMLVKFRPGKGRLVSAVGGAVLPLPDDLKPQRPPDTCKYELGETWIEGAEWMYGDVGHGGMDGCTCWHSRFQLDELVRSFVPEVRRFQVAVLDTNGNLILRIGRYGNVDDGMPLVREGGPAEPRSIGGDEVALSHAAYLGVHTDRRLFIHDAGNGRIVSVKLGYHAEETIALKDVTEGGRP